MWPFFRQIYKRIRLRNPNMMHNHSRHYSRISISTLFIIFCVFAGLAQDKSDPTEKAVNELISKTEMALGLDDELANGEIYYQRNLSANGHPFYVTEEWSRGFVIVNGKQYSGLLLKYNVETDQVILQITQKSGATSPIVLNNDFIESFSFGGHQFINYKNIGETEIKEVFHEVIYQGSFTFYTTYRKSFVSEYNTKNPYGKYSKLYYSYSLIDDSGLVKIPSKKALLNYFEPHKKEVKKFMSKNKIKFNKADAFQLRTLLAYCDSFQNNNPK